MKHHTKASATYLHLNTQERVTIESNKVSDYYLLA
jgi:hypothetical protein